MAWNATTPDFTSSADYDAYVKGLNEANRGVHSEAAVTGIANFPTNKRIRNEQSASVRVTATRPQAVKKRPLN